VKAFLDTSVLVATFYADHERHKPSIDLFRRFGAKQACCGLHSLAEIYSVLTGMPGKHRVSGDEALLFLGNVREQLTVVALDEADYWDFLSGSAGVGISGGAIYDALLGRCALKANAETLYTWNVADFKRLGHLIARRVKEP
jgi:predicted nucleic acid-binding protein